MTDGCRYDTIKDMNIPAQIGKNLDRLLTKHSIGRREFARTMGVSMSSYSRLRRGATVPFVTTIYRALGAINTILIERHEFVPGGGVAKDINGVEPKQVTIGSLLRGCPKHGTG